LTIDITRQYHCRPSPDPHGSQHDPQNDGELVSHSFFRCFTSLGLLAIAVLILASVLSRAQDATAESPEPFPIPPAPALASALARLTFQVGAETRK